MRYVFIVLISIHCVCASMESNSQNKDTTLDLVYKRAKIGIKVLDLAYTIDIAAKQNNTKFEYEVNPNLRSEAEQAVLAFFELTKPCAITPRSIYVDDIYINTSSVDSSDLGQSNLQHYPDNIDADSVHYPYDYAAQTHANGNCHPDGYYTD